jgi:hypothetical protein
MNYSTLRTTMRYSNPGLYLIPKSHVCTSSSCRLPYRQSKYTTIVEYRNIVYAPTTVFLGNMYPPKCTSKIAKGYKTPRKSGQRTYRNQVRQNESRSFNHIFVFGTKLPSRTYKQNFQTELPNDHNIAEMPRHEVLSNREKLILLGIIEDRQEAGESLRSCCRDLMLKPSQVRRWQQARQDMSNPEAAHRCSLHVGRQSVLALVKEQLLRWFFELREQGFMVTVQLLTLKACEVSAAFRRKRREQKILPCGASAIQIKVCSGR